MKRREAHPRETVPSDEDLMVRVQADDADAFEQLYDRHASRAFRIAVAVCGTKSGAEQTVREGFLSIWRDRASYQPERGSFRGWSMRIIHKRAVNDVRAKTRSIGGRPPARATVEEQSAFHPEADALRSALEKLPPAQAEVIALAYYGELTHAEIARQLSLPPGTVKGRMRLGLEKLRSSIDAASRG